MKDLGFPEILFGILIITAFVYYIIRSVKRNNKAAHQAIKEQYNQGIVSVKHISSLNIKEKIRYGVPITDYLVMYYKLLSPLLRSNNISRKVELMDTKNNEYTLYVEVMMNNGLITELKEYDSFDI